MTVCFRVYTKESSPAALAKLGFAESTASPTTKLHAAVDKTDRRVIGAVIDKSDCDGPSRKEVEGDNFVVCSDRADTPWRKFPDEINVRKTRATAE